MGISVDRAIRIKNKFKRMVDDIISTAIHFKQTHETILKNYKEKIYDDKEYKLLPTWAESYLSGYKEARMREFYRYHLEWRMYVKFPFKLTNSKISYGHFLVIKNYIANASEDLKDYNQEGYLMTKSQIDNVQKTHKRYKNIWQWIDGDKSCHCYIGFPDKPFNVKN